MDQDAEFTKHATAAIQGYQARLDQLNLDYTTKATTILGEIQTSQAKVEKLVGVIGNLGVTSGYVTVANYARRSVWLWQTVAVSAMAGVIVVAYKAFVPVLEGGFSWASFAGRALLTFTVGALAAYAASQADKYLEIERRNRKMALELEAIGPYLAPLPPEKQEQFRIELGHKSFGRDEVSLGRKAEKSPASVLDLVLSSKELRAFVSEIIKAARPGG